MGLGVTPTALPPPAILLPVAAGLGLILGSFVSALTWRLPRGLSVARGRSTCPSCDHPLTARDLVPLLSWLAARGRCRHCGATVSARYPLIEAACALLFLLVAARAPALGWTLPALAAGLALMGTLLALAVVDLEHGLLLDGLNVAAAVPALALRWLDGGAEGLGLALVGALIGGGGAWLLRTGFRLTTGRDGLGLGDVKFLAVAGLLVVPLDWPVFLFLAGLAGVVLGLAWRAAGRGPVFPFGPALILALVVVVLVPNLGAALFGGPGA